MEPKINIINFLLAPSPNISSSVVETYNFILSFPILYNFSNLNIIYDNEAIYHIFDKFTDNNP